MKVLLKILLLILIFTIPVISKACDSTRVVLRIEYSPGTDPVSSHYTETYSWDSTGTIITWIKADGKTAITYNQSGQIISVEEYYLDSINYVLQITKELYYTINNKDSMQLRYYHYPMQIPTLIERKSWDYDINDSIITYLHEGSQQGVFDTIQIVFTSYPVNQPNAIRIDSIFGKNFTLQYEKIHVYTTLGSPFYYRIYEAGMYVPPDYSWSEQFFNGRYECGVLSGSLYQSPFTTVWDTHSFDSICRPVYYSHGSTGANGSHFEEYYYYGNCNKMILLMNATSNKICRGDTVELSSFVYGGTPPYNYQWQPSTYILNDSTQNTHAFPQDTMEFTLTVSDSLGHSETDTLKINVSYIIPPNLSIVNIDSANGCFSADLIYTRTPGAAYVIYWDTVYSSRRFYNPSPVHVIYNGTYILTAISDECPTVYDTIVMNELTHQSPFISVTEGCNELIASSPTAHSFNWYTSSPFVLVYQGSTLSFNSTKQYICEAIDSLGCRSEQIRQLANYFYIVQNFQLKCNDSCNSTGFVQIYPGFQNYDILWSNGDSTEWTTTLCDGLATVTVTNDIGCVLSASNDTCTVSIEELPDKIWKLFPIPANSEIQLTTIAEKFPYDFVLTDITGRNISLGEINSTTSQISLQGLSTGTYFFSVLKDDVITFRKKLIVY